MTTETATREIAGLDYGADPSKFEIAGPACGGGGYFQNPFAKRFEKQVNARGGRGKLMRMMKSAGHASFPLEGDVHVNVPLTDVSQKYTQDAEMFIANRAMGRKTVQKKSDLYYTFDRDSFFRSQAAERADGAEAVEVGFGIGNDTYSAKVYAVRTMVTDQQRQNADMAVEYDTSATELVTHQLLILSEKLFASAFFGPGIWSNQVNLATFDPGTGAGDGQWNKSTSAPITLIENAIISIMQQTGRKPNRMILGAEVWAALKHNEDFLDRIRGGSTTSNVANVRLEQVAQHFELEQIFIMNSIETTSTEGASTTARSFIGGKHALLYHALPTPRMRTPTAGTRFAWDGWFGAGPNGIRIKRYRQESREGNWVEGQMAMVDKVMGADLGYFWQNAVA